MKNYKNCQSCGMPLKSDKLGGGTEADGSKSIKFCSNCYENGRFKQADWNLEDMQKFSIEKMKEMKIPGFLAKMFSKSISKLERWN